MKKKDLKYALKISLIFTAVIWFVYIIDLIIPYDFSYAGIMPRSIAGLKGIVLSPFIHASLLHIISNTLPLFILSFLLFLFYKKWSWIIIASSVIITGIAVWLVARSSFHVGASGLIYALAAFLVTTGFYIKSVKALLVSIFVIIAYGGLIWGVLPSRPWVSWESHLFGAATGVLIAVMLHKTIKKRIEDKEATTETSSDL